MAGSAFIILSASVSYLCIALSKGVSLPESALGVTATLAIAFFSTVVAFWSFFAGLGRIGGGKSFLGIDTGAAGNRDKCSALSIVAGGF